MHELGHSRLDDLIVKRWTNAGLRHTAYETQEKIFALNGDMADYIAHCRDVEGIARASGFSSAVRGEDGKNAELAVYIIGVEGAPISKIGVSSNPVERAVTIQAGHFLEVRLFGVIWCPTRKSVTIEQTALAAAAEMGVRLRGEWVNMEPEEAMVTVLKAARFLNAPVCNSQMWMDNWSSRTLALAKAKRGISAVA